MSRLRLPALALAALLLLVQSCAQPKPVEGPLDAEPGTIEQLGNPNMPLIEAAHNEVAAGPDDVVIYYWRPDAAYDKWGFWIWAFPGGDGSLYWDRSQKLSVAQGVGYLKFKRDGSDIGIPLVGTKGTGIIARKVDGWTKDGDKDRIFNTVVTNEWVIFSGDQKTWPYGVYRPSIDSATLTGLRTMRMELSGRHALTPQPSDNGFEFKSADGSIVYKVVDMYNAASPENRAKNFGSRIDIEFDRDVDLQKGLIVSNKDYQLPLTVNTAAVAVTQAETTVPPADQELGAIYKAADRSVDFRVWAPLASKVEARLYRESEGKEPTAVLPLSLKKETGVWSATYNKEDSDGWFYEYAVTNNGAEAVALDPYAKSMGVFRGSGPGRGAILNPEKALPEGGWEGLEGITLAKREDAIIYEVSVRDLTIAPEAGVKSRPGSYAAFIEKLPHLKSLGVTHLQLLPVLNFYYTDETRTAYENSGTATNNNYNWGYDPHSYFSPEGWFASDPADPYARVRELKTLIKEAHRLGMGVTFDVVYNHTATTSILNDLVPNYYYRMEDDGSWRSNSGCGNDTASERLMMRRLIVDSIRYLVSEYKVDGFRFDLMGLMDAETVMKGYEAAAAIKPNVLFVGEGWKMYNGPKQVMMDQNYMDKTDKITVFNDEFRDILKGGGLDDRAKGFISDKVVNAKMVLSNLMGKPQLNYKSIAPGNSLNYTEAHDNLTMRDNIANNLKLDDSKPAQRAELVSRLRLGNFLVLSSQGVAFLHSGQERGRSKPRLNATSEIIDNYVHNSYDAADNINQFVWNPHPDYLALEDYTKGMIALRRQLDVLRLGSFEAIDAAMKPLTVKGTQALGWSLTGTHDGKPAVWHFMVNAHKSESRTFTIEGDTTALVTLADRTRVDPAGISAPSGFAVKAGTIVVEPLTAVIVRN